VLQTKPATLAIALTLFSERACPPPLGGDAELGPGSQRDRGTYPVEYAILL
jgi:hypothetical protein